MDIQKFLDQNKMYSFEGERGIRNLAKLVQALGYRDERSSNDIDHIKAFLEDNSGAIDALVEWIEENYEEFESDEDEEELDEDRATPVPDES